MNFPKDVFYSRTRHTHRMQLSMRLYLRTEPNPLSPPRRVMGGIKKERRKSEISIGISRTYIVSSSASF